MVGMTMISFSFNPRRLFFLIPSFAFLFFSAVLPRGGAAQDDIEEDVDELTRSNLQSKVKALGNLKAISPEKVSEKDLQAIKNMDKDEQAKMLQSFLKMGQETLGKKGGPELTDEKLVVMLGNSPFGKIFKDSPKLVFFIGKVIRDPELLPGLLATISEQEKFKRFQYISLGIVGIGFILSFFIGGKASLIKRFFRKSLLFVFILLAQVGNMAFFFPTSAKSFFRIVKEVLLA